MAGSDTALSRIEAALARIESALPKRLAERDLATSRHETLRDEVEAALGDLDSLIGDAVQENSGS